MPTFMCLFSSISGILDLSTVYGANIDVSQRLRSKEKGFGLITRYAKKFEYKD